MIVATLFAVLASATLVGAGGILICRPVSRCLVSFLVCSSAMAGMYALLDLDFIAIVQLVTCFCMAGLCSMILVSRPIARARMPKALWSGALTLVFVALTAYAILKGDLGEPVLSGPPIWAAPGEQIYSLGTELLERHTMLLTLLAILLVASILAAAYAFRRPSQTRPGGRRG